MHENEIYFLMVKKTNFKTEEVERKNVLFHFKSKCPPNKLLLTLKPLCLIPKWILKHAFPMCTLELKLLYVISSSGRWGGASPKFRLSIKL